MTSDAEGGNFENIYDVSTGHEVDPTRIFSTPMKDGGADKASSSAASTPKKKTTSPEEKTRRRKKATLAERRDRVAATLGELVQFEHPLPDNQQAPRNLDLPVRGAVTRGSRRKVKRARKGRTGDVLRDPPTEAAAKTMKTGSSTDQRSAKRGKSDKSTEKSKKPKAGARSGSKQQTTSPPKLKSERWGVDRLAKAAAKVTATASSTTAEAGNDDIDEDEDDWEGEILELGPESFFDVFTPDGDYDDSNLGNFLRNLDDKLREVGALDEVPTPQQLFAQHGRKYKSPVWGHNQATAQWWKTRQAEETAATTVDVVLLFGKPLLDDQVTVEYASRLRTLAKLLKEEPLFRPRMICFLSSRIGRGTHVSDAHAGYTFFRHLCQQHGVSLADVEIYVDPVLDPPPQRSSGSLRADDELSALSRLTEELRKRHIPRWLRSSPVLDVRQNEYGLGPPTPRKQIHVHFTLLSSEYHVTNLNSIHNRSPKQSLLRPLERLADDVHTFRDGSGSAVKGGEKVFDENEDGQNDPLDALLVEESDLLHHDDDDDDMEELSDGGWDDDKLDERRPRNKRRGLPATRGTAQTSWSFYYANYPFRNTKDETVDFLGKCFLLGEELVPLLLNMRGVVQEREFFQKDNFVMLESKRRLLVSLVEGLYTARKSLKAGLKSHSVKLQGRKQDKKTSSGGSDAQTQLWNSDYDMEAILEGAVVSLGRCVDLVRPAGLFVSMVSKADWLMALRSLEHCMLEIASSCDPDRPLQPHDWGKLEDGDDGDL